MTSDVINLPECTARDRRTALLVRNCRKGFMNKANLIEADGPTAVRVEHRHQQLDGIQIERYQEDQSHRMDMCVLSGTYATNLR